VAVVAVLVVHLLGAGCQSCQTNRNEDGGQGEGILKLLRIPHEQLDSVRLVRYVLDACLVKS
jgi:hypothetical protein